MDNKKFYTLLTKVKNKIELGESSEKILNNLDFFSFYREMAPKIFKSYPLEKIQSPGFKAVVWLTMSQVIGENIKEFAEDEKSISSNVIDFLRAKERLRA